MENQQNANCSASVNVCLIHEELLYNLLYCTSCREPKNSSALSTHERKRYVSEWIQLKVEELLIFLPKNRECFQVSFEFSGSARWVIFNRLGMKRSKKLRWLCPKAFRKFPRIWQLSFTTLGFVDKFVTLHITNAIIFV